MLGFRGRIFKRSRFPKVRRTCKVCCVSVRSVSRGGVKTKKSSTSPDLDALAILP